MSRGVRGPDGMTPREREVMDLLDGGATQGQAAQRLGVGRGYVAYVSRQFSGSWDANDAFDAMVRRGSAMMLAAIERTGKRYA